MFVSIATMREVLQLGMFQPRAPAAWHRVKAAQDRCPSLARKLVGSADAA